MVYQGSKEIIEKGRTDWVTVGFYLLFVLLGWLNIYAAKVDPGECIQYVQSLK